jgi:hypothetical protein
MSSLGRGLAAAAATAESIPCFRLFLSITINQVWCRKTATGKSSDEHIKEPDYL